ncbi:MAG: hypothetical protein ACRD3J_12935, partial [Thermoanaerobaculia bacterium]
ACPVACDCVDAEQAMTPHDTKRTLVLGIVIRARDLKECCTPPQIPRLVRPDIADGGHWRDVGQPAYPREAGRPAGHR